MSEINETGENKEVKETKEKEESQEDKRIRDEKKENHEEKLKGGVLEDRSEKKENEEIERDQPKPEEEHSDKLDDMKLEDEKATEQSPEDRKEELLNRIDEADKAYEEKLQNYNDYYDQERAKGREVSDINNDARADELGGELHDAYLDHTLAVREYNSEFAPEDDLDQPKPEEEHSDKLDDMKLEDEKATEQSPEDRKEELLNRIDEADKAYEEKLQNYNDYYDQERAKGREVSDINNDARADELGGELHDAYLDHTLAVREYNSEFAPEDDLDQPKPEEEHSDKLDDMKLEDEKATEQSPEDRKEELLNRIDEADKAYEEKLQNYNDYYDQERAKGREVSDINNDARADELGGELHDAYLDHTLAVREYNSEFAPEDDLDQPKPEEEHSDKLDDMKLEKEEPELKNRINEIVEPYYDQSRELASNNEVGRAFTDHKWDHVEMVKDKSLEAADAIQEGIDKGYYGNNSFGEEHVALGGDIDRNTLIGAALSHDTGMAGNGYTIEGKDEDGNYIVRSINRDDFNEVRKNHSLNSAINLLENRAQYKEAGYSDEQIDKMAVECMAHSKSNSGASDLNSKKDWSDCFNRIDAAVEAYNADHRGSEISFDRTLFESDDTKLGSLASETFALRIGDVGRDSGPMAEAQSGEKVNVDRSTLNNRGGTVERELEGASILIGENGDSIDSIKSRQIHAGEQNIVNNHTYLNNEGRITHEITVSDGVSVPKCTQEAILSHMDELAGVKDEQFDVYVKFDNPCDEYAESSYEKFRLFTSRIDNYNVSVHYPWDEEA